MNQFELTVLPNQLQAVIVPMPAVKSVTALALVKAGTRYEELANNGISHFLEHLVFKGTRRYPTALALSSAIDAVGAEFNAFTGKEDTGFYVKAAARQIKLALEVVSQLLFYPLLRSKELEVERGVILEEIRMYEDQPMAKVGKDFESLLYSNTPLGWSALGLPKVIKSLSRGDFGKFQEELYRPERVVLVLAGAAESLQRQTVSQLIKEYFGVGKTREKVDNYEERFVFEQDRPQIKLMHKKIEQAHLCLGVRTFPKGDKRRYALAVLAAILGGGMSSRLFTEIREKRGLAYYVKASTQAYLDNGYLVMQAGTNPKKVTEVVRLALAEFQKISEGKFKAKELTKAKEYLKGQFVLSLEDSEAVADLYAEDLLLEGKVRVPEEILKNIQGVTSREVQVLAEEVFVKRRLNLALITPEAKEGELERVLKI